MKTLPFFALFVSFFSQWASSQAGSLTDTTLVTRSVVDETRGLGDIIKGKRVDETSAFKGKPSGLDHFAVFEISFQNKEEQLATPLVEDPSRLRVLSGLKRDRKVIIADLNGDGDFSNDVKYEYSVLKPSRKASVDSAKILDFSYQHKHNAKVVSRNIKLRILPFEPLRFSAVSIEELLDVYFSVHVNRQSSLNIDGKAFDISLLNPLDLDAGYEKSTVEIRDAATKEIIFSDPPVLVGEAIALAGHYVLIDRVSFYGDSIYLEINGNKIVQGIRSQNRLSADIFDFLLSKLHTKVIQEEYVLIDFWGSWCAPCIRSIPDLRQIHLEFSVTNKLKMISIAYEHQLSDTTKMEKVIRDNGMKWEHLAEFARNTSSGRSLVKEFDIRSFPTTILLDKHRNILHREIGTDGVKRLHEVLKAMYR